MSFYCPRDDCPNSFSSSKNAFIALPCDPCGYSLKCPCCSAILMICENCLCLMEWDPVSVDGTFAMNVCRRCGFLNIFGEIRQKLSSGLRPIGFIPLETLNYINEKVEITFENKPFPFFTNVPSTMGSSVLSEFGGDEEFSFQSLRILKELCTDDCSNNDFLNEIEVFLNERDGIIKLKKEYENTKRALNVTKFIPPTKDSTGGIDAAKIIQVSFVAKANATHNKLVGAVEPFTKYIPEINEKLKDLYKVLWTSPTSPFGIDGLKYKIFLLRLLFHTISSTVLL